MDEDTSEVPYEVFTSTIIYQTYTHAYAVVYYDDFGLNVISGIIENYLDKFRGLMMSVMAALQMIRNNPGLAKTWLVRTCSADLVRLVRRLQREWEAVPEGHPYANVLRDIRLYLRAIRERGEYVYVLQMAPADAEKYYRGGWHRQFLDVNEGLPFNHGPGEESVAPEFWNGSGHFEHSTSSLSLRMVLTFLGRNS